MSQILKRRARKKRSNNDANLALIPQESIFPTHTFFGLVCACNLCKNKEEIIITHTCARPPPVQKRWQEPPAYHLITQAELAEASHEERVGKELMERSEKKQAGPEDKVKVKNDLPLPPPPPAPPPPLKPFFISNQIITNVIESLKKNNVTTIIGESQTGKTTLVKYAAHVLKKKVLQIDDLDYDNTSSPLLNQISTAPKTLKDYIILFDVVDYWPISMTNRLVDLCKQKDKWSSHVAVIFYDQKCVNAKKVANALPKKCTAHRLYAKKRNITTENFDSCFGRSDNFDSSFEVAKKMLSKKNNELDVLSLQSDEFLENLFHWSYLSFFTSTKPHLPTLEYMAQVGDMFSEIDIMSPGSPHRTARFAITTTGIKKLPGKQVFPNAGFLPRSKKSKNAATDLSILNSKNIFARS